MGHYLKKYITFIEFNNLLYPLTVGYWVFSGFQDHGITDASSLLRAWNEKSASSDHHFIGQKTVANWIHRDSQQLKIRHSMMADGRKSI